MPLIPFHDLPHDARVWVFASSRHLSDVEQQALLAPVDAYLAQWKAHGTPLVVGRVLRHGQFLAIGVDQSQAGASGCSVDGLFRVLQQVEKPLGTHLVAGGRVFWRTPDGTVTGGMRGEFAEAAARGDVGPHTAVFDTTVTTREQFEHGFEKPAHESWHVALLPAAR